MPRPTAQNAAYIFRSAANLAVRRLSAAASTSTGKKKQQPKSPPTTTTATASAAKKKPSADDAVLKDYVSSLNFASAASKTAESLLKTFKSPKSDTGGTSADASNTSLCGIVNDSFNTDRGDNDEDEAAKQLAEDASGLLCDKMDLDWDDYESEGMPTMKVEYMPWSSGFPNSSVAMARKEFSREKKLKWVYKNTEDGRFHRLVNMCAKKLGADTVLGVFGKLGHQSGLKEYNALIKLCMENARSTTDEEISLQEIYKAYQIFKMVRETGFKIEEEMYGQFLMYLIDFGMVEEFFFFTELISGDNPDSIPRLAYYEMLLWVKLENEAKIQELCHSAVAGSDEKSYLCENYFLALCESDREQETLMLLEAININKVASVALLNSIFRSLGKLMLDSYVERFLVLLKGSDIGTENISSFIREYVISIPDLTVEAVISKFKMLHTKLEVLPTAAQYEKLIKYSCQLLKVHEALNVVDEAFESGIVISLETFHSILESCFQSCEYNLVHEINSRIALHNLKLNTETFRRMILLFVRMKDFEGAYRVIDDLRRMNLTPTADIYNTILAGYFREKNIYGAMNVLKQMEDADVKPDAITYSYLINNCVHENDLNKFYNDMRNARVQPTKHVFMALINAYASCGQFENAKKVISDHRIPTKNLNEIKSVLVGALASNGQISSALQMYEEIKEAKCDLDHKAVKALIEHFQFEGQLNKSLKLLGELHDSPYWTDACFRVISHCVRDENLRTTVDLLKQLNEKFADTDVGTEFIFDEVFCFFAEREPNHMQFGLDLLGAIKEELGVVPSRKSLDFLLSACVSAKDLKASLLIWQEYTNADLPYNVLSYVRMYQALLASGDHKSASSILKKIPQDDAHVSCVIKASQETFKVDTRKKKKKKALLATLGLLDRLQATSK